MTRRETEKIRKLKSKTNDLCFFHYINFVCQNGRREKVKKTTIVIDVTIAVFAKLNFSNCGVKRLNSLHFTARASFGRGLWYNLLPFTF